MKNPMSGNHIPLKQPEWYLLAEFSLHEFLLEDEPKKDPIAGFTFHPMGEVQLPPECLARMEKILAGIVQEAWEQFHKGRGKFSGRLRIFCRKNMIGKKTNRGWGYFQVERSIDAAACDGTEQDHFIDVYFYLEGE